MEDTPSESGNDLRLRHSVEVDVLKYQAYLDDPTLSDAQKEELISALWNIIVCLVDLGFGVHPAQQAYGDHDGCNEAEPPSVMAAE